RRQEGGLPAVDLETPGIGRYHAADDLDQRALAGAVLAENGVDRSGVDGEAHLFERDDAAVALADIGKRQQRGLWRRVDGHRSPGSGVVGVLLQQLLERQDDVAVLEVGAVLEVVGQRGRVVLAILEVLRIERRYRQADMLGQLLALEQRDHPL